MIRAYLKFFKDQGLDTWIAHGTLLGWWWNGKRLPWDWDLDTQVSASTLHYLGENHNQSIHKYESEDGQTKREYLLDVNPWIWERERGDGMNIIDARWIDIRNGLFIDITGLSETHPDTMPGVWSCKNYHRYKTTDLYPMRETVFEGVVAKVPYSYDQILINEYQEKALIVTDYEGYVLINRPRIKYQTNISIVTLGIPPKRNGSRPKSKSTRNRKKKRNDSARKRKKRRRTMTRNKRKTT
jgi:phosphorylcholine metabolism protein LicD